MMYRYHDEHIVKSLPTDTIFVFGSDLAGKHEDGGARVAHQYFGAVKGVSRGWAGQSFAIPTLDQSLKPLACEEIAAHIHDFKIYTKNHPSTTYFITALGCGLAGNPVSKIAPLFKNISSNVILPWSFKPFLEENLTSLYPALTQEFTHKLFLQGTTPNIAIEYSHIDYKHLADTVLSEKYFPVDRYGRNRTYEIEDITHQLRALIPTLYDGRDALLISSLILSLMELYEFNEKDFSDLWQGKLTIEHPIYR